ncbi:IS1/IS1595 family N-terminal zinc-binding domain-containing protein [Corynebacterium camporealensis]
MSTNHPSCPMCHSRCNKHGRTSSNRQRWRCTHCGFSFVRSNEQTESV